ncbi:Zinc transporter 9 [Strongyloides ratti]|uniref:Zinc transporter 9 n=1 Tax=Strongyloides ratti TaxID=34506 RepID=A0A090LCV1_STRRB|nr:Zinc transporter 9 [Strongyloides ratti]CEF67587.1 Zinc transporter 9 [Strongyloides ratti]
MSCRSFPIWMMAIQKRSINITPVIKNVNDYLKLKSNNLFKVARATRKSKTYDESTHIDEQKAMAEFKLESFHLSDLPKKSHMKLDYRHSLYSVHDVYLKALEVHGSRDAIHALRTPLVTTGFKLSDQEKMRLRMRVESITNESQGMGAGSKSLFAEAIHSTMDTLNQLILLLGIRFSNKNPDPNFPYGYGNMRYVTALISGCGILSFGCGLSIYHGVSGLLHPPEAMESIAYAYYALITSLCFQGTSALTAFTEVRNKANKAKMSIINYVKTSADPSLNVVLLEDTAAVTGVLIALSSVTLSHVLESPIPDCCGSILIGTLLGVVASFIIRTNAHHLVGRSLPTRITDDIVARLNNDPVVRAVHDVKTTSMGVEHSRFKAEIDFDGKEITRNYLKTVDVPLLLEDVKKFEKPEQLEKFMVVHGEKVIDRIGDEVDRLETKIMKRHRDIRHVDLESL